LIGIDFPETLNPLVGADGSKVVMTGTFNLDGQFEGGAGVGSTTTFSAPTPP